MVKGAVTPTHAVDRPALRRQLDEALTQPLTLVVAPAGAGKSVLLAQWAATHPDLDVIWMDLTRSDDNPVRFAQRLLAGLATVNAEAAELGTLVSLHTGGLGTPLLEAVTGLMAELPETVLVLDDLHQLSNAKLLADLGRLVEHLPANIHLVLSTRVDPPFAWSRHRLGRGLTEIRQADLAFDRGGLGPSAGADHRTAPGSGPGRGARAPHRGMGRRAAGGRDDAPAPRGPGPVSWPTSAEVIG